MVPQPSRSTPGPLPCIPDEKVFSGSTCAHVYDQHHEYARGRAVCRRACGNAHVYHRCGNTFGFTSY